MGDIARTLRVKQIEGRRGAFLALDPSGRDEVRFGPNRLKEFSKLTPGQQALVSFLHDRGMAMRHRECNSPILDGILRHAIDNDKDCAIYRCTDDQAIRNWALTNLFVSPYSSRTYSPGSRGRLPSSPNRFAFLTFDGGRTGGGGRSAAESESDSDGS